jgi:hypothetical protein
MSNFKELCKALLAEIPHESPTTCLAREALLNNDSLSKPTAKELQTLWQACNSPSVFARAALERWGNLKVEPVPVSEKPWERPGWCDKQGRCWWSAGNVVTAAEIDFEAQLPISWWLVRTPESCTTGRMLPFDAIPSFDRDDKTGGEQ